MRVRIVAMTMLVLALPLAACASAADAGPGDSGSGAGSGGAASASAQSLTGTAWDLTQFAPAGSTDLSPVPDGVKATAEFTADRIAGSGGCNRFTGRYTVDGSTIAIGPLASTAMACIETVMAAETDYLARLDEAATYSVSGNALTMSDAAGKVVLTFTESVPVTLTGTTWSATGINNGKQAVVSLVADTTVTAVFGEDGTITGSAGCNTYNGTYEVSGTDLTIGTLATTMMACEPDVSTQEADYLAALARVTTYSISGDQLELRDAQGALQAGYVAQ
jgi:heat shock protein HslJ